jgi:ketosteroid isomerase-like protein
VKSNVDKLRRAYREWHDTRGASVPVWLELLADDVTLGSLAAGAAGLEFSAPRRGRADAERYFADIARDWEMLSFTADEFIAEGDRVVMVGRCAWRHRKTGKAAASPTVHLWRFRDGKATEFVEFYDTAKALEAARPD